MGERHKINVSFVAVLRRQEKQEEMREGVGALSPVHSGSGRRLWLFGKSQHTFADDVALDLARATPDGLGT